MAKGSMRVMLATDRPEVRGFLHRMVENKLGGVVVGEGENAIRALRLARQLRPDMAIIDSYLPHQVNLDEVSLSHTAGLDTAQAISEEIPDVRVVLVHGENPGYAEQPGVEIAILRPSLETAVGGIPSGLHSVAFASMEARPVPSRKMGFCDRCLVVGICALLGGLVLTATLFLAPAGFPILIFGGVSLFVGFAGKLIASMRPAEIKE